MNKAKDKTKFERKVVGDLPQVVKKRVESVIDWMVESELRQWQSVMDHIEKRWSSREAGEERMVGRLPGLPGFPGTFAQDHERLLETVAAAAAGRAIEGYDRDRESSRLADSVQTAVASTAVLQISGVELGALVTIIATTSVRAVFQRSLPHHAAAHSMSRS